MKTPTANSTRIALCEARGPLNDLLDKLSGEMGREWLRALKRMLREENPWDFVIPNLAIWRTLKLGTGPKNGDSMRTALLEEIGMMIEQSASDMLDTPRFIFSQEETSLDIVIISVAELGFRKKPELNDIYERAKEFGLELCPAEVGPQLRLEYQDQPKGYWFVIGMEPIETWCGFQGVFFLEGKLGGVVLGALEYNPEGIWPLEQQFVFVRPKQVK